MTKQDKPIKLKKDGTPFASSTGKRNPIVNQENWRTKWQQRRIKFDDQQKEIYLNELLEHGQKVLAAKAAGVTRQCVGNHAENDPEFAAIEEEILEERGRRIVRTIEKQALNGYTHPCFNKDGDYVGEKQMFETRLREKMLTRFDKDYTDRKEITNLGGGGVLVVPAGQTPEEWAAEALKLRDDMEQKGYMGKDYEG